MVKITLNLPEELYEEVKVAAERWTRTVTQEVVHRVKNYSEASVVSVFGANPKGLESRTTSASLGGENNIGSFYGGAVGYASANYDEAISKIETINSDGYQPTSEEMTELKRYLKERNLQYNPMKRTLDKYENGKWSVVHKFN